MMSDCGFTRQNSTDHTNVYLSHLFSSAGRAISLRCVCISMRIPDDNYTLCFKKRLTLGLL